MVIRKKMLVALCLIGSLFQMPAAFAQIEQIVLQLGISGVVRGVGLLKQYQQKHQKFDICPTCPPPPSRTQKTGKHQSSDSEVTAESTYERKSVSGDVLSGSQPAAKKDGQPVDKTASEDGDEKGETRAALPPIIMMNVPE